MTVSDSPWGERPDAPPLPNTGNERDTLVAFLNFYRSAFLDRAWGLDAAGMNTALFPGGLTLVRLLGHLTFVEYWWFRHMLDGEPYEVFDFEADRDAEMTRAESLSIADLLAEFREATEESNRRVATWDSLDDVARTPRSNGPVSLRWILVHLIEEYARHCGHADLIRESIDGDVVD